MARVTVEDCVLKIPNRFELVLIAGQRARDISAGAKLTLERDNDKNPVVALREIADDTVPLDALQNALIQSLQKHVEVDEPEEDEMEGFISERDMAFETVANEIEMDIEAPQQLDRDELVRRIVLGEEHPHRATQGLERLPENVRRVGLRHNGCGQRFRHRQEQSQAEGGAATIFRVDAQRAAHLLCQALADRKAEAGAAEAAGDGTVGLHEFVEQVG